MKSLKAFLRLNFGMLLLFFVFLGGAPHVSAAPQMVMHEHGSTSSSNCQTRCTTSIVAITTTNPDEQKEDDDDEPHTHTTSINQVAPYDDVSGQRHSTYIDACILRPPDIIVLNCIFRI